MAAVIGAAVISNPYAAMAITGGLVFAIGYGIGKRFVPLPNNNLPYLLFGYGYKDPASNKPKPGEFSAGDIINHPITFLSSVGTEISHWFDKDPNKPSVTLKDYAASLNPGKTLQQIAAMRGPKAKTPQQLEKERQEKAALSADHAKKASDDKAKTALATYIAAHGDTPPPAPVVPAVVQMRPPPVVMTEEEKAAARAAWKTPTKPTQTPARVQPPAPKTTPPPTRSAPSKPMTSPPAKTKPHTTLKSMPLATSRGFGRK